MAAIAPNLAPGMTSVGTSASLEHRRASPVGAELVVAAELTEVDGRRLVFSFIAREGEQRPGAPGDDGDEDRVVGAGTVERVLVDRKAFLARAEAPALPLRPPRTAPQLMVAMRSPSWTTSPSATCSLVRVPAPSARTGISIFIDSRMTRVSPSST